MMKKLLTMILALAIIAAAAVIPAGALSIGAQNAQELIAAAVGEKAEPVIEETELFNGDAAQMIVRNKSVEIAETGAENYPVITAADATSNGIRIQWKAYDGAAKYRVFYKNSSGKWSKVGDTTGLYYDHKNITLNKNYVYTVRAIGKDGAYSSSYSANGTRGRKCNPPTITKVENISGGVNVTFKRPAQSGTQKGESDDVVYLYVTGGTYGSKWKLIGGSYGNSVSGPIDANNSNTALKYTLRSKNGWNNFTSVCSAVKSATHMATPTLKIAAISGAHQLTVNKIKGATKYRIFIQNGTAWKKLGDTASVLNNKNVTFGKKYVYTVRAINAEGKYISPYYPIGFEAYYSKTPTVKVEPDKEGLKISWNSTADSSDYYRVFRRNANETKWTAIAETYEHDRSVIDYSAEVGVEYTYTVRSFNQYNFYTSYYDTAGVSGIYCGFPQIYYGDNSEEGVTVSWTTEDCVYAYRLFVMIDDKWVTVGDTQDGYLTYTEGYEGETYRFTVRGLDEQGKYCTTYDKDGFYVTFYRDRERTIDMDRLKEYMSNYYGKNIYAPDETVPEDEESFAVLMVYTGIYGPNTGDVTDLLIQEGKNAVEYLRVEYRILAPLYDYYWIWEEEDGEYYGYLYLRRNYDYY